MDALSTPGLAALLDAIRARQQGGDLAGALALCDGASPNADPMLLYVRGTLLFSSDRLTEAEASFRGALELEPGNPDFVVNLAVTLMSEARAALTSPALAAREVLQLLDSLPSSHDPRSDALFATIDHLRVVARAVR